MKTQHTPGPWRTDGVMTRVVIWPEGWNAPLCIADCHGRSAPPNERERIANARLCAAAPELLAACKAMFFAETARKVTGGEYDHAFGLARAAIAKATESVGAA